MQTITVDMTPGFRQPTIHYSQNDVGTTFAIDLRSRFGDTLPASPTVKIQATKPSGFGFSIEADSVVDSVATFTTVATMTDEAGRFLAELEVSDSGVVLYTANFYMEGEANPHPIGTTDGSQETIIPTLTLLVERVEAAASSVLDMTVNATTLAAGSQATYSYDEDTNTATFGIPQGEAGAGAAGVTASAYSSSKTYTVGDYVIHNSNLYRCTTAITTAEAFTAAHWTQVVLGDDVCDLKSAIKQIGTSTEIYNLASASVSGSSAWRIDVINDVIVPQVGETYYLHIDSVTNYVDTVCARLRFRNGTTNLYYVEMTIDDVQNNRSVSTTLTDSSADNVQLLLIRNSTASAVADGATQFSGIRITKGVDAAIYIADAEFDLDSNNDFNSLKSSVNSLENELNSFEAEAQYDVERLNTIDTKNNGFLVSSLSWLSNSYAIFFDRDVFVKSINPSFNTSDKTVVYTIAKLNTDYVQDGASYEVTDTINGTTNTALTLNRVITKNTVIRMNCSDARLNYSEIQYSRTPYPYSPKICYATGGTISSVTSWANMRPMGVFEVYEQMPFWETYDNYWLGKKIVWFGTSIPEGGYGGNRLTSYPVMVGEKLGCAMYNEAIGSSSISRTLPSYISTNNPYGFDTTDFEFAARCLADNLTLKQWLIDNYNGGYFTSNVPSSMTDTLKNTIKNYSYERKVDRYLSGGEVGEADLYVFDQGYNDDFENRDVEALEAQYGIDTTYCFDGGMNFLIRRILTSNPDAKIVIISHYTNNAPCGNQINTNHVEAVCAAQKAVADRWGIKFINLYEQLGWSGQIITTTGYWDSTTHEWVNSGGTSQQITVKNMHVRDKTHPFTDASGKSNTKIAEVLASEIERLYK